MFVRICSVIYNYMLPILLRYNRRNRLAVQVGQSARVHISISTFRMSCLLLTMKFESVMYIFFPLDTFVYIIYIKALYGFCPCGVCVQLVYGQRSEQLKEISVIVIIVVVVVVSFVNRRVHFGFGVCMKKTDYVIQNE